MDGIKKYFYIIVGFLSLGIGMIGIVLPILPTTPFLLLTSFCFVRGSKRFEVWFKGTSIYKKHLENFVTHRAMTLKQKVILLAFADTMMLIPCILVDNTMMRVVIGLLILFKFYYFIFKIKTIKS